MGLNLTASDHISLVRGDHVNETLINHGFAFAGWVLWEPFFFFFGVWKWELSLIDYYLSYGARVHEHVRKYATREVQATHWNLRIFMLVFMWHFWAVPTEPFLGLPVYLLQRKLIQWHPIKYYLIFPPKKKTLNSLWLTTGNRRRLLILPNICMMEGYLDHNTKILSWTYVMAKFIRVEPRIQSLFFQPHFQNLSKISIWNW